MTFDFHPYKMSCLIHSHGRFLKMTPNNKLEQLKRNRVGQWSIRINDQWRVCFRFEGSHAYDVGIVDDH